MVATGPYQFLGSENLDFSLPADEQTPVAGYEPGKSIQLVRNPNYDPATDGLRPAYPDGFNVSIGGDNNDLYNKVQAGELDGVVVGCGSVHLVQHGHPTVRRRARPQGVEPRLRQSGHAHVPWR